MQSELTSCSLAFSQSPPLVCISTLVLLFSNVLQRRRSMTHEVHPRQKPEPKYRFMPEDRVRRVS